MIVQGEEVVDHLLRTAGWEESYSCVNVQKLTNWKKQRGLNGLSPIEHLFIEHQLGNKTIRELAKETKLSIESIRNIFRDYSLPNLTKEESLSRKWLEDPEFRERHAEAVRIARHNPKNIGKYALPTIHGYRADIDLEASSMWEANLARVIMFAGREFTHQTPIRLRVEEKYRKLFNSDTCETSLDFMTTDNRGNTIAYEIMAHPLEAERDWAMLEMTAEQYRIRVVPITERFYKRVEKKFKDKINNHSYFAGWEDMQDNLRTNPTKYGISHLESCV